MLLSPDPNDFFNTLQGTVDGLLYPSESDVPFSVHRLSLESIGERFSEDDLVKTFYHDQSPDEPLQIEWTLMERIDTRGYSLFFRDLLDKITQRPQGDQGGEIIYWEPAHRENADKYRRLRDLFMDNLINQRWFKVHLPDNVNKAIFIAGQFVSIEFDENTNAITPTPGDWFVLQTGTVES